MNEQSYSIDDIATEAQMGVFWRTLHFLISRYGNNPMGQLLVTLTMIFLNERGTPPSMTDLCEVTGLPKASVSRYVTTQIKAGLLTEEVDPNDRRRRYLLQTAKGKAEWQWQIEKLEEVFKSINIQAEAAVREGFRDSAETLMEKMIEQTENASRQGKS